MPPINDQPAKDPDGRKNSLEEMVHRHLNDKNDKITDDDLKNMVVGTDAGIDVPQGEAGDKTIREQAREMEEGIPTEKKGGPLDVLSSD